MKQSGAPPLVFANPSLVCRRRLWAAAAVSFALLATVAAAVFDAPVPPGAPEAAAATAADATEAAAVAPRAAGTGDRADPERRLVAAYEAVAAGRVPQALGLAASLVTDHPEFALAQALYADLLATSAGQPVRTMVERPASADERLVDLHHEARARIAAVASRPAAGQVPAEFVALPGTLRHAIAVDVSRQRLYLLENGPEGLRLLRDYYVSVGRSGAGKQIEGDRRTPLGIYWITQAVTAPMRDPRLGAAALKINYPNAWDRSQGRTGSGLYIHGVPGEVLSRAPLSTDGCVALSNPDILELHRLVQVGSTPVVIARRLRWLPQPAARDLHRDFLAARDAWAAARSRADAEQISRWYAIPSDAPAAAGRDSAQAQSQSIFAWDYDDTPLMVVTSHRTGPQGQAASTERQYWGLQQGHWRILFDEALVPPTGGATTAAEPDRSGGRAEGRRPPGPAG